MPCGLPAPRDCGQTVPSPDADIWRTAVTTASADHLTAARTRGAGHVDAFDADLHRALRRTSAMRQAFYMVVLLVALAGQVSGAVQRLDIPLLWAIPAVAGLAVRRGGA